MQINTPEQLKASRDGVLRHLRATGMADADARRILGDLERNVRLDMRTGQLALIRGAVVTLLQEPDRGEWAVEAIDDRGRLWLVSLGEIAYDRGPVQPKLVAANGRVLTSWCLCGHFAEVHAKDPDGVRNRCKRAFCRRICPATRCTRTACSSATARASRCGCPRARAGRAGSPPSLRISAFSQVKPYASHVRSYMILVYQETHPNPLQGKESDMAEAELLELIEAQLADDITGSEMTEDGLWVDTVNGGSFVISVTAK